MKDDKRFRFPKIDTVMSGIVVAGLFVLIASIAISPDFLNALA